MEIFQFVNHKRNYKYINNSDTIELGNGYSFVSKPRSPMLKEFTLTLTGFRYYFDENDKPTSEINKYKDNVAALCSFYETMGTWQTFIYPDEQFGNVQVRFSEPLEIPQTDGKRAVVKEFSVTLQEVSE
jgi:antibiotic biosynthesis monooxygenase (ABM) superfamily enzyme